MSSVKHRQEKNCLNCGHIVEENFCSRCGQENLVIKENAWSMISHAVADYFHFEHKFFATLRPLLLKPGQLTKDYVSGKRASFIHPIRLYIFVSIVFFIFAFNNSFKNNLIGDNSNDLNYKVPSAQATKKQLENALEKAPKGSWAYKTINKRLNNFDNQKVVKPNDRNNNYTETNKASVMEGDTTYQAYLNRIKNIPEAEQPSFLRKYLARNQIKFKGKDGQKKFTEGLTHNIPKMMFILLPLFALMLHIFYIKKKKYYYEDLIYSFHLHSNIFLTLLVMKLIIWSLSFFVDLNNVVVLIYLLYVTWYIYRSLRVFYNSTRWRTVFKMFFLFFGYNILLAISIIIIAAFTVMAQ